MNDNKDPNEMVTVNLTTKRPYRVRKEDRTAIEVGPGFVSVPRWVAEAWKMTPIEPVKEPQKAPPVRSNGDPDAKPTMNPKAKPTHTGKKAR